MLPSPKNIPEPTPAPDRSVGQVRAKLDQAITLHQQGLLKDAQAIYEDILNRQPKNFDALHLLGVLTKQIGNHQAAVNLISKAITICPNNAASYSNLGNALKELRQLDAAVSSYDRAIAIRSDYAEAYFNRGGALHALKQLDAAVSCYDRAIAIKSDYAEAYWDKSLSLLLAGDFENGWTLYEWRWRNKKTGLQDREFKQHLWLGNASLRSKTILIHNEQGLGDTIQFCRYVKLVANLGARVFLELPRSLMSLLANLEGVAQLVEKGQALPDFDYQCPLMSLPLAFKTTIETIPASTPYLHLDADRVILNNIATEIDNIREFKVGICWQGSKSYKGDTERSPGIGPFKRLFQLADIRFFTLQVDSREEFLGAAGSAAHDLGHEIDEHTLPFEETAALIMSMDLVITSDTSIAHLAGALGKVVWIVLPFVPDWRWMVDREDSPWYPNARLFRQARRGDWDDVFERVSLRLKSVLTRETQALWPIVDIQ